ncbi:MAG: gliding motility-associated C-terminal domain-containing protein [Cyclobacteriaceae bacterium]|nr:gliding motility-associated C-terminal domain-containing protein [Cyclobacteriaceae bacterium]
MIKRLLLLLLLISTPAWASHIVGGEFELLHIEGSTYRLNLNLYFDVFNGLSGAQDARVNARIYQKSDNTAMMDVTLPLVSDTPVEYTQQACAVGELDTKKLIYSTSITLDPNIFNDPQGYYVAWERCCRNYSITNIISDDSNEGGLHAGQAFYLEFPPVVKNGEPFINSSPQLFPPLSNYGCPNRAYWVDFAGSDADGDSLAYSLVTPLSTHTANPTPPDGPGTAPFPFVTWQNPFGINNIMNGSPDLFVSNEGFLTVTPTQQGLYVFSVKCEEFRDGEKIGEVIRDFQMLVLAICPVADPPEIAGRKLGEPTFSYLDNMVVNFANTVNDEDRCIEVQVSDPDALKVEDNFTENIYLKVIPLNFKTDKNLGEVLPTISNVVLDSGSVESFKICFDKCPYTEVGNFKIGVIAFDDACALPLSDTLRIEVGITPPDNSDAYFVTDDKTVSRKEGIDYTLVIEGKDDDNDMVVLDVITEDFNLADVGMSFIDETLTNGQATTTFVWKTGCDIYDFTEQTAFEVKVLIDDLDECDFGVPDTLTLNLQVILPPNTDPIISTDLPQVNLAHTVNTPLNFNVFGFDADADDVELTAVGDGFDLLDYEMNFPALATGNTNVEGHFSWTPPCSLMGVVEDNKFKMYFLLNDIDKCKFPNIDSLEVTIYLVPLFNSAPSIRFNNLNTEVNFLGNSASLTIGQVLKLDVIAEDEKADSVWLNLLTVNGEAEFTNFSFENAVGAGGVTSELEWLPDCSNLETGFKPKDYTLAFGVYDNKCANVKADTVEIVVSAKDVKQLVAKFMPANIITPNNDGKNDYYSLPNLPIDDCWGQFIGFRVHNRWGVSVYETIDRNFKWKADGLKTGVYYYGVKFTNKDYNGTITILY